MARYQVDVPNALESVGHVRRALVHFARCAGLGGTALEDFESAIGEALANAAEHGGRSIAIRAEVVDTSIRVEIGDGGRGFEGWNNLNEMQPKSSAPRGFGIFIMRSLMDHIEYSEGGSRIRLVKRLSIPSEESCREA
jgi:anti-sigma regulatory factor (Ser/Thr protein kinase)